MKMAWNLIEFFEIHKMNFFYKLPKLRIKESIAGITYQKTYVQIKDFIFLFLELNFERKILHNWVKIIKKLILA